MNDPRQLVGEPGVILGDPLVSAPVVPSGLNHREQSFHSGSEMRPPRQERAAEDLSSWLEAAQANARSLQEDIARVGSGPIAYARLAQAHVVAGLNDEAVTAANQALTLAARDVVQHGTEHFDQSSALSSLRVLRQLGDVMRVKAWLSKLPKKPSLIQMAAEISVEQGDYVQALSFLSLIDASRASSMRGYIYLQTNHPEKALRELRNAARQTPRDPNVYVNMAFAYWRLGVRKKAVVYARQATELGPWRKDISLMLLELLLATGQPSDAQREIKKIRDRGYIETAELLVVAARAELDLNRVGQALVLLRRALGLSRNGSDSEMAELIQANISVIELQSKSDSAEDLIGRVRKSIDRSPVNVSLIELFASVADRSHYASELRRYIDELEKSSYPAARLYELRYRLAYLEGDFEEALRLADLWSGTEQFNPQAATSALLLRVQLVPDAELYKSEAIRCARQFGNSHVALNNVSYALALCGEAGLARKLLHNFPDLIEYSFYLKATAGLVEVASGNLESGMRLYRQAADMADRVSEGLVYRSLMTIHQAIALCQLGLLDSEGRTSVVSQALPPVTLPDDWEDRPHFAMLKAGIDRRGWPWPLEVE